MLVGGNFKFFLLPKLETSHSTVSHTAVALSRCRLLLHPCPHAASFLPAAAHTHILLSVCLQQALLQEKFIYFALKLPCLLLTCPCDMHVTVSSLRLCNGVAPMQLHGWQHNAAARGAQPPSLALALAQSQFSRNSAV